MKKFIKTNLITIAAALLAAGSAAAQCDTYIDFEDHPDGTPITNDYDGVVFMAPPSFACSPEIEVLPSGTSSGTNALMVPGCPEFSTDYLRMVFDVPHAMVSFTFAEWGTPDYPMKIRAYTTTSGGSGLIYDQMLDGGNGAVRLVTIGSVGGPVEIRRVEVETLVVGAWECIDDLRFGTFDPTPPTARIDSPGYGGCVCGPDLVFTGIACDDDGAYGRDRLEFRPAGANHSDPWILIDEVVGSPVCTSGFLYSWDLDGVPHGRYDVRLTVTNACGLQSMDFVSVFIDKQFVNVSIESPPDNAVVCGMVEFIGTINDGCQCFDFYTLGYSTSIGGPFTPVAPGNPVYLEDVKHGLLAMWNTVDLGLPDGTYYIEAVGTDHCGNTKAQLIKVHLENAAGCGCPADMNGDGMVGFDDLLTLLASWGPCV